MAVSRLRTVNRYNARLVLNRAALNEVQLAIADGAHALLGEIARDAAANVHFATDPHHIRYQWGFAVYVDGRKNSDDSYDATATNKPREFKPGPGLSGIVGFGFPARFHEVGTSDTGAYPFLTPAAQRIVLRAVGIVRAGAARRLGGP